MDFEGQKLAEKLYQYIIILFGIIGWIAGFIKQSFQITVYSVALGTLIALIVCLPNYSFFNKHQLKWLQPKQQPTTTTPTTTSPTATK
ncbi:signal peptidase complex subunit 1 [Cavenderia fasciculata]|uniref:Signal peptidase complex subunit 1 n=1 Tax=Cavenderia fasciculata TaxID=261658 RepID=F4QAD5_CACFS|nr:signal peptidase complex subunit 1 [Cavenderia fasciculata]EGG15654.1 signal peptidase complex subunit 1 [Cavenderia fasciculata]|eukprot:XP_004354396.1 signal peptidase complex subunit 1 [Cavenderia fasciculata]